MKPAALRVPSRSISRRGAPSRRLHDAPASLQTGRVMARAWSEQVDARRRQSAAWSFTAEAVRSYMLATGDALGRALDVPPLTIALTYPLDVPAAQLAQTLGRAAAMLPLEEACYQLSATYTALLPPDVRSAWGAYYTPPALTFQEHERP